MYRNIIFLLSILILATCQNNDDTTIYISPVIGKWHLIEQYSDPGDGSGSYEPVETDEFIEFVSDGAVKSNRNIGNGAVGFDEGTATFDPPRLNGKDRKEEPLLPRWRIVDNQLIISYACFEVCGKKYERVKD